MAGFALHVAAEECYEAAALPGAPYGELLPSEQPRLSMARRVPAGVVGVISPFNVPLILGIRSVAPALALGNAVLLKPDPRTAVTGGVSSPASSRRPGCRRACCRCCPGGADVGEALVDRPAVRVISFTGSTAAGRAVGELAGRHLKRAHLELGGNSALIVLDDADVDQAVNLAGAWGSFFHQGQICMTTGRHLVRRRLARRLRRAARRQGRRTCRSATRPPAEVALGPLIDAGQRDKIHALVTASADAGARRRRGRHLRRTCSTGRPCWPTCPRDAPGVRRGGLRPGRPGPARSRRVDEAVALAARHRVRPVARHRHPRRHGAASRSPTAIPTGIVHINDQTVNDEANAPFGGVGASGTGSRFGGAAANIDAFTETRWITMRREPPTYPF